MKTKLPLALLLIATGTTGCRKASDDGLGANIASAFSDYAANQQNAGAPESIFPDAASDNTSDDLNADMLEAANTSVAIGAAQGVMGEDKPDPDGPSRAAH